MLNNLLQTLLFVFFIPVGLVQAQGLILSEVMVDPVCINDDCEFVELKNQSIATIDIGGWKVTDGETGINEWTVTFPDGTSLGAWEFVIVAKNTAAFNTEYPGAFCAVFQITNVGSGAGLANAGDNVNLLNPSSAIVQTYAWGASVDRATYDGSAWTPSSGGTDGDPCGSAILPIVLIEFKAYGQKTILLTWRTATETNNSHFSIERSANGRHFFEIGQVQGAGTSFEVQDYIFTDESPRPGLNYYRLRQVDFDGQFSYSHVVTAIIGKASGMRLMPSPATDFLTVQLEKPAEEIAVWQVFDQAGKQVLSGAFSAENVDFEINVAELPAGIYALRLAVGQGAFVQRFQKK